MTVRILTVRIMTVRILTVHRRNNSSRLLNTSIYSHKVNSIKYPMADPRNVSGIWINLSIILSHFHPYSPPHGPTHVLLSSSRHMVSPPFSNPFPFLSYLGSGSYLVYFCKKNCQSKLKSKRRLYGTLITAKRCDLCSALRARHSREFNVWCHRQHRSTRQN